MADGPLPRKRFWLKVFSAFAVLVAADLALRFAESKHLDGWPKSISTQIIQRFESWRSSRQEGAVDRASMGKVAQACVREVPSSEYADIPTPQSAFPVDFRPSPNVDARGFIDVWQLRHDLAIIEPFLASDTSHLCRLEYESDGISDVVTEEQRQQRKMRTEKAQAQVEVCRANVQKSIDDYNRLRDAFNAAWMPVLLEAVQKGDQVAEVILLNCETSPVFDRSRMPSTCTDWGAAVRRLKDIGFAAAIPPAFCSDNSCGQPYGVSTLAMQNHVLDSFRNGGFGQIPYAAQIDAPENGTNDLKYKLARNRALIEAAAQDVQRAFVYGPSEYINGHAPHHIKLSLNRSPLFPPFLTWGPELILGGGRHQQSHWRTAANSPALCKAGYIPGTPLCRKVFFGRAPRIDPKERKLDLDPDRWIVAPEFEADLTRLLQRSNDSIAATLNLDPRWSVFLLNRIGHHEWVPEGMQSASGHIDRAWGGQWQLTRQYVEFIPQRLVAGAVARIEVEGATTHITIQSTGEQADPIRDVRNCILRYSGGATPLGKTPFGKSNYIGKNGSRTLKDPARNSPCGGLNGLDPLDPATRYKQVLMQCEGAEMPASDRVRFLLRNGDTMIEVASEGPEDKELHIRHFSRIPN